MLVAGRRVKLAALAAGVALLAGCGVHPGAAAVVGSDEISTSEVDDVAVAVCSANLASARASNATLPTLPTRGARQLAMQILLEGELSRQFGEHEGVSANQQQVSQALAQNEQGFAMLPADQRDDFKNALKQYAEGQLILLEIGKQKLGKDASDNDAINEGKRLRDEYVKSLDVQIDPRFGRFENGAFKPGGTSLSVAQSSTARAGDRAKPADAFVAGLPSSQQCS
ncbi:MAG TPA: hypothetical protein VK204_16140 [Nocardioidaceae bacterium]|nr:hypothetical protein [Nocardioidaceae bacterium]